MFTFQECGGMRSMFNRRATAVFICVLVLARVGPGGTAAAGVPAL